MVRPKINYSNSKLEMFEFYGLSSDDKPVDTFEGRQIWQGSTFYEMDTCKIFVYSEEDQTWYPMEGGE